MYLDDQSLLPQRLQKVFPCVDQADLRSHLVFSCCSLFVSIIVQYLQVNFKKRECPCRLENLNLVFFSKEWLPGCVGLLCWQFWAVLPSKIKTLEKETRPPPVARLSNSEPLLLIRPLVSLPKRGFDARVFSRG